MNLIILLIFQRVANRSYSVFLFADFFAGAGDFGDFLSSIKASRNVIREARLSSLVVSASKSS
jgi:hypothetical protein